jgi:hypothetical protein
MRVLRGLELTILDRQSEETDQERHAGERDRTSELPDNSFMGEQMPGK